LRNIFENRNLMILLIVLLIAGPGMSLLSGGLSGVINWVANTVLMLPGIVIGLSFHEFAHAKAAVLCGDNTPLYQGRVTLDPKAHIDPAGLVALVFIHFGWGRPVQVNPSNYRNRKRDSIIVGLAGVVMNFFVAVAFGAVLSLICHLAPGFVNSVVGAATGTVLLEIVIINISLMLFNLLPVPPLDGFGVITDLFNLWGTKFYVFVFSNSWLILMAMILMNIPSMLLSGPLVKIVSFIMETLCRLPYWYAFL